MDEKQKIPNVTSSNVDLLFRFCIVLTLLDQGRWILVYTRGTSFDLELHYTFDAPVYP